MARTVVIFPERFHTEGLHTEALRAAGFAVRVPKPRQALLEAIGDAEAVIVGPERFAREAFAAAPRLRAVVRSGVGYENIDLQAAAERGIAVAITPGVNHESVAEHALAMMLALARGFPRRDLNVRRGTPWLRRPLPRMAGRTLGIVGLGRIGRALATRVSGLQLKLLAHDPQPDREFARRHGIELVGIEDLLKASDIVTLHLPLTPETRGLIDRKAIAKMKPGAILINTGRGGLVVEEDLHAALTEGRLAGAGLDVFATEPVPPDHPLLALDNVLLSPHVAGLDEESYLDAQRTIARIIIDLAEGRWPADCLVNLRGVSGWRW